jgi:hypothetical protein
MDDSNIIIEDELYSDKNESEKSIDSTVTILPDVDELLTERVERIFIRGQIDGN